MNANLFTQHITATTLTVALITTPVIAIGESTPSTPAIKTPVVTVPSVTTPVINNAPAVTTTTVTKPASESPLPIDLVDERPTFLEQVWDYSTFPIQWTWGVFQNNILSWFSIPSPSSIMRSVSKKDASLLFKLLGDAGYKLKEISVDVGLIPTLYFKFVQVRELSEADYEYLESQVATWERTNPGMYSGIQRRIIKTVMAVNLNSEYKISALKVKILPLPDVAFEMMPGGVSDFVAIMSAINKVGRSVREVNNLKISPEEQTTTKN